MTADRINILLVDDDPGDCRLVKRALEKSQQSTEFAIETAGTLAEGLQRLRERRFDLMLLDLGLPDSQGLETLNKIHAAWSHIAIIVLTGLADEQVGIKAIKEGAGDYLVKGEFNADLLTRTIRYALQRKQAEETLTLRLATIEATQDMILITDREGIIEYVNPAFSKFTGFGPLEAIGQKPSILKSDYQDKVYYEKLWKTISSGRSWKGQIYNRCKNGRIYPEEMTITPVKDEDGQVQRYISIKRDVTERKRTEEKLMQIRTAVDNANDAIVIIDQYRQVVYANRATCDLFGVTQKTLNETGMHVIFQNENIFHDIFRTFANGCSYAEQVQLIDKDKRIFTAQLHASAIMDKHFHFTSVLFVINDVTEQINAMEAEQQHQNLQKAIEAMQQVLGIAGHELRTPLAALRATSEYLLTDGAWQAENTDQFLKSIHSEVVRLSEMVNNMLEAARVNNGAVNWKWEMVRLDLAYQDTFGVVSPFIDQDNVTLEFHTNPQDLHFTGDHDAIVRLLINLINNSAKFTSSGTITVTARALEIENYSWIEIVVQDTGDGIDNSLVEKLGQAFVLNSGMIGADYVKGAGLGLSICKGIVAAHGGGISVDSTIGKGTTFTIRLRADLTEPCLTNNDVKIVKTGNKP